MLSISNPWHIVSYGEEAPKTVNAIIEIPSGSKAKYEVDKETGLLKLDRVLNTAFFYPINYGFIPQTFAGDGDPLDILVLSQIQAEPLCIMRANVIGVMRMEDKGADDKIIAVCADDMSVNHITNIDQLPPHFFQELKHFFLRYKELENKKVVIEDFFDKNIAFDIVRESIELYNQDIKPTLTR